MPPTTVCSPGLIKWSLFGIAGGLGRPMTARSGTTPIGTSLHSPGMALVTLGFPWPTRW